MRRGLWHSGLQARVVATNEKYSVLCLVLYSNADAYTLRAKSMAQFMTPPQRVTGTKVQQYHIRYMICIIRTPHVSLDHITERPTISIVYTFKDTQEKFPCSTSSEPRGKQPHINEVTAIRAHAVFLYSHGFPCYSNKKIWYLTSANLSAAAIGLEYKAESVHCTTTMPPLLAGQTKPTLCGGGHHGNTVHRRDLQLYRWRPHLGSNAPPNG